MTVQQLIENSLRKLGNTDPSPDNLEDAFNDLNSVISNITWWDESVMPVYEFSELSQEVILPNYYTDTIAFMLAAEMSPQYGISDAKTLYFEKKALDKIGKLVNRRNNGTIPSMKPTTFVV